MVYFQTKYPNFGKFWRALEWKMLLYFMIIWNFKLPFGIIFGRLVYLQSFGIFFPIWFVWSKKNLAITQLKKIAVEHVTKLRLLPIPDFEKFFFLVLIRFSRAS
jgi:hypothetical protein